MPRCQFSHIFFAGKYIIFSLCFLTENVISIYFLFDGFILVCTQFCEKRAANLHHPDDSRNPTLIIILNTYLIYVAHHNRRKVHISQRSSHGINCCHNCRIQIIFKYFFVTNLNIFLPFLPKVFEYKENAAQNRDEKTTKIQKIL